MGATRIRLGSIYMGTDFSKQSCKRSSGGREDHFEDTHSWRRKLFEKSMSNLTISDVLPPEGMGWMQYIEKTTTFVITAIGLLGDVQIL